MICDSKKNEIKRLRDEGKSLGQICKISKMPKSTIQFILKPKVKTNKRKTGRPKIIKSKERKVIKESIRRLNNSGERISCSKILKKTKVICSQTTISRYLNNSGMSYKKIPQKIDLNDANMEKRVECVLEWISKGVNFRKVLFTDEKKFNLDGPDNFLTWVPKSPNINKRNKRQFGGGSIMAHGCICSDGSFYIQIVKGRINGKYYTELLGNVFAHFDVRNNGYILQHDGASSHRCKLVTAYLLDNNVQSLKWPAKSPDLNIIEYMWKVLSDIVYQGPQFKNLKDLEDRIKEAVKIVNEEKKEVIKHLYEGMTLRIQEIIKNDGKML